MKQTITAFAILLLAGCQNPTAPSDVNKGATVEPIAKWDQFVVATEETSPGVWNDMGVLRVCDAPTQFFHNGQRIMQIVISADLPCPR